MDSTQALHGVLALILAVSVHTANGIHCYDCNSGGQYEGGACADPLDTAQMKPIDCDTLQSNLPYNYTMCRKIGQDVEGDYRVVRSCAVSGRDRCYDRTGTDQIKIKYCECFGENCNGASQIYAPLSTLLGLATALIAALRS